MRNFISSLVMMFGIQFLNQQTIMSLVPNGSSITKCDENGTMVINKTRLVSQNNTQVEGVKFD